MQFRLALHAARAAAYSLFVVWQVGSLFQPLPLWAAAVDLACPAGVGDVASLVDAITLANANNQDDVITLPAGCVFTLTTAVDGENGLPPIMPDDAGGTRHALALVGNGAVIQRDPSLACDSAAADTFRLFQVEATADFAINDLTLAHGCALGPGLSDRLLGGAILNQGTLRLTNVAVEDSQAIQGGGLFSAVGSITTIDGGRFTRNSAAASGGAIGNGRDGRLTVQRTIFEGNLALALGGAVHNVGTLFLEETEAAGNSAALGGALYFGNDSVGFVELSTLQSNTAEVGGAIAIQHGEIALTNSTLSGNMATNSAGAIFADGETQLTNVTLSDNSGAFGGGIVVGRGPVALSNSLLGEQTAGENCEGDLTFIVSEGFNLDGDGSCGLAGVGDLAAAPEIGPLADNGGPTPTHALLPTSPAVDAGDCVVLTDQRGVTRPQGSFCDIGAFELETGGTLCIPDPNVDLRGTIQADGTVGEIHNRSAACTYTVGLAAYAKVDSSIARQELFDFETAEIPPNETLRLGVSLPTCAVQIDLFWGEMLPSLAEARYGERLISARHPGGREFCPPSADVRGLLRWAGAGVAGVQLALLPEDGAEGRAAVAAETSAEGFYHFSAVEPGNYWLLVDADTLPMGVMVAKSRVMVQVLADEDVWLDLEAEMAPSAVTLQVAQTEPARSDRLWWVTAGLLGLTLVRSRPGRRRGDGEG